jgi:hypothetical protein
MRHEYICYGPDTGGSGSTTTSGKAVIDYDIDPFGHIYRITNAETQKLSNPHTDNSIEESWDIDPYSGMLINVAPIVREVRLNLDRKCRKFLADQLRKQI